VARTLRTRSGNSWSPWGQACGCEAAALAFSRASPVIVTSFSLSSSALLAVPVAKTTPPIAKPRRRIDAVARWVLLSM
jgi:hypothetical protein